MGTMQNAAGTGIAAGSALIAPDLIDWCAAGCPRPIPGTVMVALVGAAFSLVHLVGRLGVLFLQKQFGTAFAAAVVTAVEGDTPAAPAAPPAAAPPAAS